MRMIRSREANQDRFIDHIRDFMARRAVEIVGLCLLLLTAAGATALLTWSVTDPSLNHATSAPVRNFLGWPGAIASDLMIQLFGLSAGAILIPIGYASLKMMSSGEVLRPKSRLMLLVLGIVSLSTMAAVFPTTSRWPLPTGLGGYIGDVVLDWLTPMISSELPAKPVVGFSFGLIAMLTLLVVAGIGLGDYEKSQNEAAQKRRILMDDLKEDEREPEPFFSSVSFGAMIHWFLSVKAWFARLFRPKTDNDMVYDRVQHGRIEPGFDAGSHDTSLPSVIQTARQKQFDFPESDDEPAVVAKPKRARSNGKSAPQMFETDDDGYAHPSLSLLAEPKKQTGPLIPPEALEQNARLLEGVLDDFGVRGEIVNVRPGPVVTLYELEPAPGIKSSRVVGLADDIARSMSAISARVAVVPGRNAIGIELPNQRRETVFLREMLASEAFANTEMKLALCLGKTIGGDPVIAELTRMPHLLVAGTTGSGKSVAINTMILSLLYRLKPEECRLIMVDPKMLELSVYDGIPHLLTPVVTDPKKAILALKWAVREMEERYKKMSKLGVRNIDGFNARVAEARAKGEEISRTVQTGFDRETGQAVYETEAMSLDALPYIVIVVDEMADLMMVAGKDIEGAVQRLAQMARAAGIHVILATQRPSVDVITGTIKANFPTRISFQVTSKIDSRTILGEQGAEQLLGQGDMLYMMGGGRISRVHGPFVSDAEVERVVAHLKSQGQPQYLETVTEDDGSQDQDQAVFDQGSFGSAGTDLYDQAVAIVLRDRKASTSYIQRRLQIGYNRAASLIERMENEGIVGAPNHAGKRDILLESGHRDSDD
jgi:DNA segregation ATPase FtsK/SpoIIIE, S-DNA-T family